MRLKLFSIVLISLFTTGCFNNEENESEASTSEPNVQSWPYMLTAKGAASEEDSEAPKTALNHSPQSIPRPLATPRLFDAQLDPADEIYRQKLNSDLNVMLQDMAHTAAADKVNSSARELNLEIDRLRSNGDGESVGRVRRSFDSLVQANRNLAETDPNTAMSNQYKLNQVEQPLSRLEEAHRQDFLNSK